MRCRSTRRRSPEVTLVEAIAQGLAPDGGLYLPVQIPTVDLREAPRALPELAAHLLAPFFVDEPALDLPAICRAAFTFDAPLVALDGDDYLLELFHGPTAAFKDFGARFLAETLAQRGDAGPSTVLVATSGDTGAAVAAAFAGRPGVRVVILYPDGRVSPRQAHQLGAFGGNVRALRVAGTFDDCQALVKHAFSDEEVRRRHGLRSANSISLGRLLPQLAYYAQAALTVADRGLGKASFVVPTGNLGNAFACLYARAMGLPIDRVVLATNANRVLVDLVERKRYAPHPAKATLANAMDVGAPSNVERLLDLYPDPAALSAAIGADTVDDEAIRATIRDTFTHRGRAICPHTACGVAVLARLRAAGATGPFVVASTAHAAKFESIVEPLIGRTVEPPAPLAALLARPSQADPIPPSYAALRDALDD